MLLRLRSAFADPLLLPIHPVEIGAFVSDMPTLPRLNPTPYFPDYAGPHQVGTAEVEIPVTELQDPHVSSPDSRVTTISFRVYYPCRPGATAERPVRWIPSPQSSVVSAYARFLGAGHGLSKVLA